MKLNVSFFSLIAATGLTSLASGQTWLGGTSGDWADGQNWVGGVAPTLTVPPAPETINIIFDSNPAFTTVTVPTAQTSQFRNQMLFNAGAGAYVLEGGSLLTGSGSNFIIAAGVTANQTINSPMSLEFARGGAANVGFTNNSVDSTLFFNGGYTNPSTAESGMVELRFRGLGNATISASALPITGFSRISKTGPAGNTGVLTINSANTFSGGVDLGGGAGSIVVGNSAALGTGPLRLVAGGVKPISANTELVGANAIANEIQFVGSSGTALTTTVPTAAEIGALTFTVADATGITVGSVVTGNGVLYNTLVTEVSGNEITINAPLAAATNASNYTFAPYTSPGGGTTLIGGTNAIEFSGNMKLTTQNSNLAATTQVFQTDNTAVTTFSGVISEAGGVGSIEKTGAGVLALSGANTYSGNTTVTAGTMLLNSQTGSATGTSGIINVNTGATLGGNGQTSSLIAINAGATLRIGGAPGVSTGILTTTSTGFSALVLDDASFTVLDINTNVAGAGYDAFVTPGRVNFGGELTLNLVGAIPDGTYNLFSGGSYEGDFFSVGLTGFYGDLFLTQDGDLWEGTIGGRDFTFDSSTGTFVVPEPSTVVLLIGGLLFGAFVARRRRLASNA